MRIKTYTPKPEDIQREWFVVDAKDQTLGRLATQIAQILRGKHKPIFSPHMDVGDFVIVLNCDKIHVTGNKLDDKMYYRHSGYPGGLRSLTLRQQLDKFPDRVIQAAVRGMLPKNKLGRKMIKRLKIYAGDTHPHQAQKPKVLEL
ncbi:MAG: 50S ribosomal protein L13 [Anaerolineae bacterium]|jgi:large subunit ribosomal protein L13|nr:50S ribosomal protein L13 [Anaerolineae bacterium]